MFRRKQWCRRVFHLHGALLRRLTVSEVDEALRVCLGDRIAERAVHLDFGNCPSGLCVDVGHGFDRCEHLWFTALIRLKPGVTPVTDTEVEALRARFVLDSRESVSVRRAKCCLSHSRYLTFPWVEEAARELERGNPGICAALVRDAGPEADFGSLTELARIVVCDQESL